MAKAMDFLRKLRLPLGRKNTARPPAVLPRRVDRKAETAFDQRLQSLGRIRKVTVARAVLFRTRPAHQEA